MREKSIAIIAEEVFAKVRQPLHYRELTKLILERKQLHGKTPAQTVRSVIGTSEKFKRVAEGIYCPTEWDEYPRVRFGKDIAYDVLSTHGAPMEYRELGEAMLEERSFKGSPINIAVNSTVNDERFFNDRSGRQIGLSEWRKE